MNDDNLPMVKKETLFNKLFKHIKNIFQTNKSEKLNIEENNFVDENKDEIEFSDSIRLNETKYIELQLLYDNGKVDEKDLTNEEIEKLISMYNKQTEEIENRIEIKKKKIQDLRKKLAKPLDNC